MGNALKSRRICSATIAPGMGCTALTFPGTSATTQVMAVTPYPPSALMVFRSACAPAPALLSEPAMVRTTGSMEVGERPTSNAQRPTSNEGCACERISPRWTLDVLRRIGVRLCSESILVSRKGAEAQKNARLSAPSSLPSDAFHRAHWTLGVSRPFSLALRWCGNTLGAPCRTPFPNSKASV